MKRVGNLEFEKPLEINVKNMNFPVNINNIIKTDDNKYKKVSELKTFENNNDHLKLSINIYEYT